MPPSRRRIAITLAALLVAAFALALAATRLVAPLALAVSEPTASEQAPRTEDAPNEPSIPRDRALQGEAATAPREPPAEGRAAEPRAAEPRGTSRRRPRRRPGSAPSEGTAAQPRVLRRDAIAQAIAEPSVLGPVTAEAHAQDGQPTGLLLSGIQPGSPLATVGLRNGDVLVSVNGFTVHHPDRALEALTTLPDVPELRVRILRSGSPRTLRFSLR